MCGSYLVGIVAGLGELASGDAADHLNLLLGERDRLAVLAGHRAPGGMANTASFGERRRNAGARTRAWRVNGPPLVGILHLVEEALELVAFGGLPDLLAVQVVANVRKVVVPLERDLAQRVAGMLIDVQ